MTPGTGHVPRISGTKTRVPGPSPADEAVLSILLIEDDPSVRSLLDFVLVRDGWRVDTAASGSLGIRRLERQLPDVILLDLSMPDMDGWDVLARRAAEPAWSKVPVVAMSAEHRHREMLLELGATAFLPKPFTLDELRETLCRLVKP
jgi:CheY-like chemotaxis protein